MQTFACFAFQRNVAVSEDSGDQFVHSRFFEFAVGPRLAAEFCRAVDVISQEVRDIFCTVSRQKEFELYNA